MYLVRPSLSAFCGGFEHDGGCLEIRLAELEVHDVGAAALQGLGAFGDLHGEERLDRQRALRPSHDKPLSRRRTRRISRAINGPCRRMPTLPPACSVQFTGTSTMW